MTDTAEILYETTGAVATLTLNRPHRLNALTPTMADGLDAALTTAQADSEIRVIRLRGAGRGFCAGYDLDWATAEMADLGPSERWDPVDDFSKLSRFVDTFASLWHSPKPVIAQVHGPCVGGGSDLALCADLIVCADDCRIGYPPARIWGSPTTAMWFYRLGLERAKRLLLTGDPISGTDAAAWGFASGSYPLHQLDQAGMALSQRVALIPSNQLRIMKMTVNTAVERMGLLEGQKLGTLLDGAARHTPEGFGFAAAAIDDLAAAVAARDEPFGDYGSGARTATSPLHDWRPPAGGARAWADEVDGAG